MRLEGHVTRIEVKTASWRFRWRKMLERISLEKPRGRQEYNIKMDLKEIECESEKGFVWLRIVTSEIVNGLFLSIQRE